MPMAPVSRPDSRIHSRPVSSPLPFRVAVPANSGSAQTSPSWGITTVTPVRTGPWPTTSGPSPEIRVVCPTRIPATSVMALRGPGAPSPIPMPRSRARGVDGMLKARPSCSCSVGGAGRDDVNSNEVVDVRDRSRDHRWRPAADRDVRSVGILAQARRRDLADLEALLHEQAGDLAEDLEAIERQPQLDGRDGRAVQPLREGVDRPQAYEHGG